MSIITIKKLEVAKELLEAALLHYLDSGLYFASIQCAGAAEELFGSYVVSIGGTSACESMNEAVRKLSRLRSGQEASKNEVTYIMNYAKNATKHRNGTTDDLIEINPKDAAKDLIDRAVTNYNFLMRHYDLDEIALIQRYSYQNKTGDGV